MVKVFALLYFWSSQTSVTQTTDHLEISLSTVLQWYQYFQDICTWKLLHTDVVLGGPGKTVQIDESVVVKAP